MNDLEDRVNKLSKLNGKFEILQRDVNTYEKIIQQKTYLENIHEFQEVRRLNEKFKKIQDE